MPASADRADHDSRPSAPGRTDARVEAGNEARARPRTPSRLGVRVPRGLEDGRPWRRPGPSRSTHPVAAPAGRRGRGATAAGDAAWSSQISSWNSPNVSSSPTVQPSPICAPRVVGQLDIDRQLTGRIGLRMEDLLGRGRQIGDRHRRRRPSRRPPWKRPGRRSGPRTYGKSSDVAEDRRHRGEDRRRPRVERRRR